MCMNLPFPFEKGDSLVEYKKITTIKECQPTMTNVKSSNLGYPRIGEKREWKKALEQFWAGKLDKSAFLTQMDNIRLQHLQNKKACPYSSNQRR